MADLKMPELNSVLIAGNLTKDPAFRNTSHGTPVVNFCIATNRKYRDSNNNWQEDVCYVGIVAWNKLADSCIERLRKGNAVLIDGELQTRTWRAEDGSSRSVLEVKARRIQFLNKQGKMSDLESGNGRSLEDEGTFQDEDVFSEIFDEAPNHESSKHHHPPRSSHTN